MERYNEISEIVLNILKTDPDDMSIVNLADKTHIHRNVLAKYLKVLEAQGKIEITRTGAKKYIQLSKRVPSSFLSTITNQPFLVFDKFLNIVDVSKDARELYSPSDTPSEGIDKKSDFKTYFLTSEIKSALNSTISGKGCTLSLDTIWNGESHSFKLQTMQVVLDNGRSGVALIIEDVTDQNNKRLLYEMTRSAYEAILEDQIQFVVRFDTNYKILYSNSIFATYLGVTEDSLINSPFISEYPSESYQIFLDSIIPITHDHPLAKTELRRVIPSGDISWERWNIRGITDPKNNTIIGFHAVGIDITEFKRNEQELNHYKNNLELMITERTNELRQVNSDLHKEIFHRKTLERELVLTKYAIDHAHDLVFLLNSDGEIQYMNQKSHEVIGDNKEKNIRLFITKYPKKHIEPDISISLDEIIPIDTTVKGYIQNSSDVLMPVEITTSLIQYNQDEILCCIARDITDRKKVEHNLAVYRNHLEKIIEERTSRLQQEIEKGNDISQSLKEIDEKYKQMVDYSLEAVIILNISSSIIIDINPKAQELFGYSIGDTVNDIDSLLLNDRIDDDDINGNYFDFIHTKNALSELTFSTTIHDVAGNDIPHHARLLVLPSETDKIIRASFYSIDF